MPLYAYGIAKGYKCSVQHKTVPHYVWNLFVLAVASQLPYYLMMHSGLNTVFTWLFSLLLLSLLDCKGNHRLCVFWGCLTVVCTLVWYDVLPVDYGVSGVLMPLLFYVLIDRGKETTINYVLVLLGGWTIFVLQNQSIGCILQVFSVFSAFVLTIGQKVRWEAVKRNKKLYYWFYPVHMVLLLTIKFTMKGS